MIFDSLEYTILALIHLAAALVSAWIGLDVGFTPFVYVGVAYGVLAGAWAYLAWRVS